MFGYKQNFDEMFKPDEVLVYLRKSRSDDPNMTVEEVLQKHEESLDGWSEKNLGAKVPEENKYREIVSGESLDERVEAQKVLKMIESPKIKAVLVIELERLSRGDTMEVGLLSRIFRYTNTYVISTDPERIYDLRSDDDRDRFERELKRGNEYLEYFKKIQKRGTEQSVSSGNFVGSVPPYGYDKTYVMDGKRKCPTLAINEEQADIVRMVFDLYANHNMGRHKIALHLDGLGIKPPKGVHWSESNIRNMLANVHYIGKIRWNFRKTIMEIEDGEIVKRRPQSSECEIVDGRHEGIVPIELWNAVQDKLGRNTRHKANTKVRNPFASILYCSCGRSMTMQASKIHNGIEKFAPRLTCLDQAHCHTGSCLLSEVTALICGTLEDCIEDFELKAKEDPTDTRKLHLQQIKRLEKELADLKAKELTQWEMQSDPDPSKRMPHEIFKKLNEKLQADKEKISEALRTAYDTIPDPVDYVEKAARFKDALEALQDPSRSAEEKNKLLKACIERIEYHRDKPERVKRLPSEKKGTRLRAGGKWTDPQIEIEVSLRV